MAGYEPSTGGSVEDIFAEEIVHLSLSQLSTEKVSADELLGYRVLKRRS